MISMKGLPWLLLLLVKGPARPGSQEGNGTGLVVQNYVEQRAVDL